MDVMEKILKGELVPDMEYKIANPEYEIIVNEAGELLEDLKIKLPKEEFVCVNKMYQALIEMSGIQSREYFKLGMSIGIKMMKEADKYLEQWDKSK